MEHRYSLQTFKFSETKYFYNLICPSLSLQTASLEGMHAFLNFLDISFGKLNDIYELNIYFYQILTILLTVLFMTVGLFCLY